MFAWFESGAVERFRNSENPDFLAGSDMGACCTTVCDSVVDCITEFATVVVDRLKTRENPDRFADAGFAIGAWIVCRVWTDFWTMDF